jgi:hypothetical protein
MGERMNAMRDRRRETAKQMLGGKCVECRSAADLEFDHSDPATKSFEIAKD